MKKQVKASVLKWECTREEFLLIVKIVERANSISPVKDRVALQMDIEAVHCNDMKLDLQRLLDAPQGDFGHDVFGIQRHIDRRTGKLQDFFCPRLASHDNG